MKARTKALYLRAWPLFAFSILCYFITSSVASSMNVAAVLLEQARGWDSVLITSMISIASLGNVVAGFIAGRMSSRFSAKRLCMAWGLLYIAGLALMGFSREFALFSVSMVLANAAASALGYNTVPVLLANWFPTKKGTVQGFVSMGIPLGAGFASIIYTMGFSNLGVDGAFVPFMVIAAAALALLALGITDTPEECGCLPDTLESCKPHVPRIADLRAGDPSGLRNARELLHNPRFVVLSMILGIQLFFSGGLMVQLSPRLLELGYTLDQSMVAMLASSFFACIGSFVCGVIGDRFGSRIGAIISFVVGIIAIAFNLTGQPACVFVSLALIGIVVGGADNWPVNICAEYFGREGFAGSFGLMLPIIQLVGAVGPSFFALISGATGSYVVSYVAGAALMLFGLIAFIAFTKDGMFGGKGDESCGQ